jgi:hypothetical protein
MRSPADVHVQTGQLVQAAAVALANLSSNARIQASIPSHALTIALRIVNAR